jgi:uncharacterized damage-inducible protein DinB
MTPPTLSHAVEAFAHLTRPLADAELDTPWAWEDYDSEGVRFAFFRVYETLRTLAVQERQTRSEAGRPTTSAQEVLAQYHAAYRDLQAALIGVPAEMFDLPPAEGQWPVRATLNHIVSAEAGFFAVISYALTQHRAGATTPARLTQQDYDAILGMDEATGDAILHGPLAGLQSFHARLHGRVLRELAEIGEHELDLPSIYWESAPMSLRFRLHRFDSHMRQHTVQIDKALHDLGHGPTEARRLLRLVYAALAEAEAVLFGATDLGPALQEPAANAIAAITAEIAAVLG